MNKYTIYRLDTGQIMRMVTTPEDPSIQLQDGEAYIDDHWNDQDYIITHGAPELIPPAPSQEHIFDYAAREWVLKKVVWTMEAVRAIRDQLLKDSDWTQFPDSPLSNEKRAEWRIYRQALRDITEQNINDLIWPQQPE